MIELENASVTINDVTLLPPTTISIPRAETVALRGPNGSGKTTVLRLIAGQVPASAGTVLVAGTSPRPRDPAHRARVAGMIGLPPFARDLTLLEHATLIGVTWGSSVDDSKAAARTMLDAFRMGGLGDRFPHELSSGQTQLAGLALTLIRPADILLLDEPEQRLDAERLALVTEVLRRRAERTTIVVATHSDRLATELCARPVHVRAA